MDMDKVVWALFWLLTSAYGFVAYMWLATLWRKHGDKGNATFPWYQMFVAAGYYLLLSPNTGGISPFPNEQCHALGIECVYHMGNRHQARSGLAEGPPRQARATRLTPARAACAPRCESPPALAFDARPRMP
ncbi:MAG: hypothetical protein RDU24_13770 [Humidesulfovibrio sp.]|nr:hypothetical protein [Humidesulfovibrio sp.]